MVLPYSRSYWAFLTGLALLWPWSASQGQSYAFPRATIEIVIPPGYSLAPGVHRWDIELPGALLSEGLYYPEVQGSQCICDRARSHVRFEVERRGAYRNSTRQLRPLEERHLNLPDIYPVVPSPGIREDRIRQDCTSGRCPGRGQ
jgi:hypothetical protein